MRRPGTRFKIRSHQMTEIKAPAKKRTMRQQARTMSVESSMTTIPPVPSSVPAFCNESGREKRHGNNDGVHRRKQGWLWCTAGCFWTWHSWDGCEGIDETDYVAPSFREVPTTRTVTVASETQGSSRPRFSTITRKPTS